MTTINTSTDRVTPEKHPTLFGVKMTLKDLQREGGAKYGGVRCELYSFSRASGTYYVSFSVRCPRCEHTKLRQSFDSSTGLVLREIRARLLDQAPCPACKEVDNRKIAELKGVIAEHEKERQELVEVLTGPTGIAATVEVDHRSGRYTVVGGDFLPGGDSRTLYPTWLQQRDPDTMRQLKELLERLEAIGQEESPRTAKVMFVSHPTLDSIAGVVIKIAPSVSWLGLTSTKQKLAELKEHRKRMRAVERANKARRSKKSD